PSPPNGRAILAGVELVDVVDERADLERLREIVRLVELMARRLEPIERDDALFDQDHRERMDLRRELLDDVRVTTAKSRHDLGHELFLLGRELVHGSRGLRTMCQRGCGQASMLKAWPSAFRKRLIFH